MIILDTNIISEFQKPHADDRVRNWFEKTPLIELGTCSPVIMELAFGSQLRYLRTGNANLLRSLEKFVTDVIESRIFEFDSNSAMLSAKLRAENTIKGSTRPVFDLIIAAICITNGATLATRNTKDFVGLDVNLINPFEDG